jgi:hypothetical protein
MSQKLEELFNLPPSSSDEEVDIVDEPEESFGIPQTYEGYTNLEKIDAALPAVKNLEASDKEMDQLAETAMKTYQDLVDLGMNVEARFSSEIFSVASSLLGHAITAKTAKMNKKLKMIDLQLKKAKLDADRGDSDSGATASGHILDRNELLDRLLNPNKNNDA